MLAFQGWLRHNQSVCNQFAMGPSPKLIAIRMLDGRRAGFHQAERFSGAILFSECEVSRCLTKKQTAFHCLLRGELGS
jgi:hypothetical protein